MGTEKNIFDMAISRAEHFCYLYGLVHQVGSVRTDAKVIKESKSYLKFKKTDELLSIKGKGANGEESLLFIKNPSTKSNSQDFEHEYASELLRASIVSAVAALDKYMHEITTNKCFKLLRGSKKEIPKPLLELEIPAHEAFGAAEALKKNKTARPGNTLKKLIQSKLYEKTMQGTNQIDTSLNFMGIKHFWKSVAKGMGTGFTAESVQKELNNIVKRRNKIVHEADFIKKLKSSNHKLQEIKRPYAEKSIKFIMAFVEAADTYILNPQPQSSKIPRKAASKKADVV